MALLKVTPGEMLINSMILFVVTQSCLIRSLSLNEVILKLKENTDFQQSVNSSFHGKVTCEDAILKVSNRLIKLVCFGKYHTQLVKEFTFLLKVR